MGENRIKYLLLQFRRRIQRYCGHQIVSFPEEIHLRHMAPIPSEITLIDSSRGRERSQRHCAHARCHPAGCDAIEPIVLFAAAVLASPVSFRTKIPGILIGWILLLVINLLRLVTLFIVAISFPTLYDVLHEHIWQAVFVVLAIVFWAIWVQWATRPERGSSNATG